MLMSLFTLFLLMAAPSVDAFKKEMAPLQSAVDDLVSSTGAQVLQRSRATYIEGYGVIVFMEMAFEPPQGIFTTPKRPEEVRATVAQRRKDVEEKLKAFVKQRIVTANSIAPTESLTIVLHVLNTNPVDVPKLPGQILFTAKKESPQQVVFKEI
jgi:hypothetical protein